MWPDSPFPFACNTLTSFSPPSPTHHSCGSLEVELGTRGALCHGYLTLFYLIWLKPHGQRLCIQSVLHDATQVRTIALTVFKVQSLRKQLINQYNGARDRNKLVNFELLTLKHFRQNIVQVLCNYAEAAKQHYPRKALNNFDGSQEHTCNGVWGYAPWENVGI